MVEPAPALAPLPAGLVAEIERCAVEYARAMGARAVERYLQPVAVEFKQEGERDPVSEIDRFVEDFIRTSVGRDFPGHGVLGEEREQSETALSPFLWVVDPIDGTANYLSGYPFFAVSIGVLHDCRPLAAAVFVSTTHRGGAGIYHARAGGRTCLDGEPVAVWPGAAPAATKVAGLPRSFPFVFASRRSFRRAGGDVRITGSIAAELCLTAAGAFQFVVFGAPKIWDVAAGVLLVAAAGGTVLTWERERRAWLPFTTFQPARDGGAEPLRRWTKPLIAANPQIAAHVAANIRPRGKIARRIVGLISRLY
ncbi:MAG: inositol monophosphatase [Chloroflexi bacterium]|nr:inositol monophosphatase [Chloroflexota bacterium]